MWRCPTATRNWTSKSVIGSSTEISKFYLKITFKKPRFCENYHDIRKIGEISRFLWNFSKIVILNVSKKLENIKLQFVNFFPVETFQFIYFLLWKFHDFHFKVSRFVDTFKGIIWAKNIEKDFVKPKFSKPKFRSQNFKIDLEKLCNSSKNSKCGLSGTPYSVNPLLLFPVRQSNPRRRWKRRHYLLEFGHRSKTGRNWPPGVKPYRPVPLNLLPPAPARIRLHLLSDEKRRPNLALRFEFGEIWFGDESAGQTAGNYIEIVIGGSGEKTADGEI